MSRAPACLLLALCFTLGCRREQPSQTAAALPEEGAQLAPEQVIVQPSESPIVELRLVFEAGSADDPKGKEGLAYVMLKSMLEGRAGALSYSARARALYPMAAEIDGFVGRAQSVLAARVHRDHLERFYPLLRDLLRAPAFDEVDVERVRTHALSSLTQDLRGSDDEELGKQALQAMIYEGGPDAHPEIGTESGLSALRAPDVAQHFARVMCARRLRVALSGPISEAFVATLRRDLGALDRPSCSAPEPRPRAVPREKRVLVIDKPEAQSIAISLGLASEVTRSHPDYAALTLAMAYLGQHRTFAGLLMRKVREARGLNYGDYAYAEHFEQDGDTRFPRPNVARRAQYVSFWLRPLKPDQAHFALRLVLRELSRLVAEGISEAELVRMRNFADRYYSLYAQTEQQRLGNAIDDRFYGRAAPHLDTLRAGFRALTREQVNGAITRHLALDQLQIAVVAPQAELFAKALREDEPSPVRYSAEKPAEILEEDKLIVSYRLGLRDVDLRIVPVAQIFY